MSETTEEIKPEAMEEVKPEVAEEIKPEVTEEIKPETVEETKPEVTENLYPEIDNPREVLSEHWTKLHEKQWIFPAGGSMTLRSGEDIYMTPKMKSSYELKPDELYVFDNEDADDITEAPEHLEVSNDAEILMGIYKLRKPGAILHSVHCKAMMVSHLFRGNEYRLRYHAMIQAVQEAKESEDDETDRTQLTIPIVYDPKKLSEKLKLRPQTPAVLIKGQGLFVWGKDLNECIFRTEAFHQMFEFSIEMEKHAVNDHKNFTPKTPVKKPVENGTKKNTPQSSADAKKPEIKKTIARRPAAENGVKTGRVKKNFKNNRGANVGNFQRNKNAPNNKGNSGSGHLASGGGGVQVWQKFGKKQKQNMNVIMNY